MVVATKSGKRVFFKSQDGTLNRKVKKHKFDEKKLSKNIVFENWWPQLNKDK